MKKTSIAILTLWFFAALPVGAADAKENWATHCARCHGVDGSGKTKMGEKLKVKDFTNAHLQAQLRDGEMIKTIKEGIKQDGMTRMKGYNDVLSEEEIRALVLHIRTFKK